MEIDENSLVLPKGIKENIFQYRFRDFLKKNGKPFSGKPVIERLGQALTDEAFKLAFEQFVVDEISNGRNRQVFMCSFSIESLAVLGNNKTIRERLLAKGLPSSNFNILLNTAIQPHGTLVYLNIQQTEGQTEKVSMAFLHETTIEIQDEEGVPSERVVVNYVWIDIFPQDKYLQIKIRPYSNNYFVNLENSKRDFEYYWRFLKDLFGIVYTDMSETKGLLYNIFKELTAKADAPYAEKVKAKLLEIEAKIEELAHSLELSSSKEPVDIPNRVSRLFERALILSDLINYRAYDGQKIGIVDRIDFSDQSGAKVNALSGNEGIEVADIYFDTRETLDELKSLNKLWVRWFIVAPVAESDPIEEPEESVSEGQHKIEQVETRLEVYDNRVSITFLNEQFVPKEVQDYVLSLFRSFEEGESTRADS